MLGNISIQKIIPIFVQSLRKIKKKKLKFSIILKAIEQACPDSISQEELKGDEIPTSKRPDDALLFI